MIYAMMGKNRALGARFCVVRCPLSVGRWASLDVEGEGFADGGD